MTLTGFTSLFTEHHSRSSLASAILLFCDRRRRQHLDHSRGPIGPGDQEVRPPLAAGRLIALDGEAGYQAGCCRRAGTSACGAGNTRSSQVPLVIVPPGEIALVVAADGAPIPSERILAREVACDDFQDAEAFLRGGGERGRSSLSSPRARTASTRRCSR